MGMLIALEGIDGAGGETQSKRLVEHLKKIGKKVLRITHPDYSTPSGKLIQKYLSGQTKPDVNKLFQIFTDSLTEQIPKINDALEAGKIVVADRYFNSTLAYQGFQRFPLDKALQFAQDSKIPVPDLVIYLDISAETSMKRKMKEKGSLDVHEGNKKFLEGVIGFYKKLIAENAFAKEWVVVDAERGIEEVKREVQRIVDKRLE